MVGVGAMVVGVDAAASAPPCRPVGPLFTAGFALASMNDTEGQLVDSGVVAVLRNVDAAAARAAIEAGADLIKVFPASTVGPGHLSAIQAPLGDLPLMPTGGVGPDNAAEFVAAVEDARE